MILDGHSDFLFALNRWNQRGEADAFCKKWHRFFQRGQVEGGIFVLWADPNQRQSVAEQVQQQLHTVQTRLEKPDGMLQIVRRPEEIDEAQAAGRIYAVLGAEGLDGYAQDVNTIDWLYDQGVRHIGLTWNGANGFASGVSAIGGLTALGRAAVQRIQQHNMLLDTAHLNDGSLRDVLRLTQAPLLASHCNSRRLCPVPRNLTDDQIRAIAATGGVIGVNSYPPFLAMEPEQQTLDRLVDHLVYLADLVGTDHLGFGFDLNFWEDTPTTVGLPELDQYRQTDRLLQRMKQRGFCHSDMEKIGRGNVLRLVRAALA